MTLSLWARGHVLAGHVRLRSSTDIMNSQLELSQQWGHGALIHSLWAPSSFCLTVLSITLSFTPFSLLSLPLLSHLSHSISFFLSLPAWKKLCPFPHQPLLPSLPPIKAWIVFYVKLTLIRRISAPPLHPPRSIPPSSLHHHLPHCPKYLSAVRQIKDGEEKKRDKSMLSTSLHRKNESILLYFPPNIKKQRGGGGDKKRRGGWVWVILWIEWCWHELWQSDSQRHSSLYSYNSLAHISQT